MKKTMVFLCVASMVLFASGFASAVPVFEETFDGGLGCWNTQNATLGTGRIAGNHADPYAILGEAVHQGESFISRPFSIGRSDYSISLSFDWYFIYRSNNSNGQTDSLSLVLTDGGKSLFTVIVAELSGTSCVLSDKFSQTFSVSQSVGNFAFRLTEDSGNNEDSVVVIDNIIVTKTGPDQASSVSEPATLLLLGPSLVALGVLGRRRKKPHH